MNAMTDAINNLEKISSVLEKHANKPENYNSTFASYLEIMSWEMHKQAADLRDLNLLYGEF